MQLLIVAIILICTVLYTGYRILKTFKNKNSTCSGCPLNEVCKKSKTKV